MKQRRFQVSYFILNPFFQFRLIPLKQIRKAENTLSFIETSALDASNVDAAFQNILSGESDTILYSPLVLPKWFPLDIYRIVSSKTLEQNTEIIKPSEGNTIPLDHSVDPNANKSGSKCC